MAQQDARLHTEATPLLVSSTDGTSNSTYGHSLGPSYGSLGADAVREGEQQAEPSRSHPSTTLPTSDSLNGDVLLHTHTLSPVMVGSAKKTFFNIVITIVGSGVLGLPYTFMRSGWLLGSVTVIASALLSYHCMLLLVRCRKRLEEEGTIVSTYSKVGFHACGELGERAVDTMVVISQGSCCVAYLLFIAANLSSIVCRPSHPSPVCLSDTAFVLLGAPFQVMLSWVRSLTGLVPFSIVADVANLLAMGLVIRADLEDFEDLSGISAYTGLINVPFAMGVACYCYEGFAMTLPLEASMKNPRRFPSILGLAVAAITVLYVAFGLIGYLAFKGHTKEIITLNLHGDWVTVAVKLGLCLGLFLTFPVMMHPVHEIVEDNLAQTPVYRRYVQPHPQVAEAVKKGVRASIVLLAAFIALRVPAFATFIALVGSSVCAMLAFVLPGLFHFSLSRGDRPGWQKMLSRLSDFTLIVFGLAFAAYGTWDALSHMGNTHV